LIAELAGAFRRLGSLAAKDVRAVEDDRRGLVGRQVLRLEILRVEVRSARDVCFGPAVAWIDVHHRDRLRLHQSVQIGGGNGFESEKKRIHGSRVLKVLGE
jgi:hypothetical protein